jgi:hypothetical protein
MRTSTGLAILLLTAAACSENTSETALPTGSHLANVESCPNGARATPLNNGLSVVKNTSSLALFNLKNTCTNTEFSWLLSATRTGAVASIGSISPNPVTLTAGQTKKITVHFTAGGSPGTGTVVLHGEIDGPPNTVTATDTIHVTN